MRIILKKSISDITELELEKLSFVNLRIKINIDFKISYKLFLAKQKGVIL